MKILQILFLNTTNSIIFHLVWD